jgi:hypothetical protein
MGGRLSKGEKIFGGPLVAGRNLVTLRLPRARQVAPWVALL